MSQKYKPSRALVGGVGRSAILHGLVGSDPHLLEMSFPESLEGMPGTEFALVAYQQHRKVCGRVVSCVSAPKSSAALRGTSTMNPILAN